MALKPWREIAEPRDDVCKGTFQQAEFAADISAVRKKTASKEYTDPEAFFAMTYITAGMKELIKSVLKRISGTGGDPVVQLKTAFGGGKTHSLLAVYHIANQEKPLTSLNGVSQILDELNIIDLPKSRIVIIDGTNQNASQPTVYGNVHVNTLWGDIAWQLGGAEAFELVKKNDQDGTSPTKDIFITLLSQYGPVVILMDELVRYISQFKSDRTYVGGTYNSNLSFIQNLTEAVKQVPTAILLASLPNSDREAGDDHGIATLNALEHYFGRVQAIWRPVETKESFEIVRRRLFKPITDDLARKDVCKAFADYYYQNAEAFPPETQESTYYENLVSAYPIHPELFDRLYDDWSSLANFQRTRGVLKLMAKVISQLWINGNTDYLIMPGNLPLDSDVKTEFVTYLDAGWDPVLDGDVDGERSESYRLDSIQPRLGKELACRKVARTIFLGTAPGSQNRLKRGIDKKQIMLGTMQPEHSLAIYSDALDQISNKLHYLNIGDNQYWFDIRQNLTKEMEERKKRFNKDEYLIPEIKSILSAAIKPSGFIEAVHVFTQPADIPDDRSIRLVILPPGEHMNKMALLSTAQTYAKSVLQYHGVQIRKYQNRLIFLSADENCIGRFKEHIVSMLAWQSIIEDYANNQLILDNIQAETAKTKATISQKTAKQSVRECYKHLLIPEQTCSNLPADAEWRVLTVNPGIPEPIREIQRMLRDEEYIIDEWSPVHLNRDLAKWYWKNESHITEETFWDDSCRYLYLPRLSNEGVLHKAIENGQGTKDYFGIAYGYEDGKYIDFRFGDTTRGYIPDKTILLIDPKVAETYLASQIPVETPKSEAPKLPINLSASIGNTTSLTADFSRTEREPIIKRFFGSIKLDPDNSVNAFVDINEEVIRQFTNQGADVTISVEIHANNNKGFSRDLQRTIKENCNQLKFDPSNTDFSEE